MSLCGVVAPLVGASDLPWRMLCRRHGAAVVFTQMWVASDLVAHPDRYLRRLAFALPHEGGRLVCQLAGDDPAVVSAAGRLVAPFCSAIDLNLGCPQSCAREGHFGAWMVSKPEWGNVSAVVRALVAAVAPLPVSAKIRLQPSLGETLAFARCLEAAGVSVLTVHGRKRGAKKKARAGPANLSWIKEIVAALRIPVVTNGNVRNHDDVHAVLECTGAVAVMSGEGILQNPAIFSCAEAAGGAGCRRIGEAADGRPDHRGSKRRRGDEEDASGASSLEVPTSSGAGAVAAKRLPWLFPLARVPSEAAATVAHAAVMPGCCEARVECAPAATSATAADAVASIASLPSTNGKGASLDVAARDADDDDEEAEEAHGPLPVVRPPAHVANRRKRAKATKLLELATEYLVIVGTLARRCAAQGSGGSGSGGEAAVALDALASSSCGAVSSATPATKLAAEGGAVSSGAEEVDPPPECCCACSSPPCLDADVVTMEEVKYHLSWFFGRHGGGSSIFYRFRGKFAKPRLLRDCLLDEGQSLRSLYRLVRDVFRAESEAATASAAEEWLGFVDSSSEGTASL